MPEIKSCQSSSKWDEMWYLQNKCDNLDLMASLKEIPKPESKPAEACKAGGSKVVSLCLFTSKAQAQHAQTTTDRKRNSASFLPYTAVF